MKEDSSIRLMYVEDDEVLAFVTKDNLELKGYQVSHFTNGRSAYQEYLKEHFDLCIVDIMLPIMDGFTLAKEIRALDKEIPIIFLTAKSLKEDKIKGLQIGADDYILKPFSFEELVLKIEVFLKRKYIVEVKDRRIYKVGTYTFDYPDLKLVHHTNEKRLTQKEAEVLKFLIDHKNEIIQRSEILKKVWKQDDYFTGRSLDVFISRLRKYLSEDPSILIENIHSVGFKLIC
jgi:DNA-binding response OmpR family regulator